MSDKESPPRLFLHFFRWYCDRQVADYIEGDLMEAYAKGVRDRGKRAADWKFIIDVVLLFRPGIIRKGQYNNINNFGMYLSYLRIGWRNLVKNKGYSVINIGGLAVGMAVAMLIGLWIHDELSFDTYHKNYNRIARVMRNLNVNNETHTTTILPSALGDELRSKYSNQFSQVVMSAMGGDHILSTGEDKLSLQGEFIEAGGPEMFTLIMVKGTRSGLEDPHSILISQSAAESLFGNDEPVGKSLTIDNNDRMEVKVTGVYEDLPNNSSFSGMKFYAPFDLFVSANPWAQPSFTNDFLNVYVSIAEHTNFEAVSASIKDVILDNVRENKGYVAVNPQLLLHPMKDWHLRSEWKNGVVAGGAIQNVWLFGVVAGFVLILACINFMNLSTARSEKRAKEIGIRKAIGSVRMQLVSQFFSESFLVASLAFVIAFVAVTTSLHWFNDLSSKQIEMPWTNTYFWVGCLCFVFTTGLLAGSYPALYLSSFNATSGLKGSVRMGRFASLPRKILVVVQFTVSVSLIVGTLMVYQQIQFAKDRPVGYSREGLLMIQKTSPEFNGKYSMMLNELKSNGTVVDMAESSSPPTGIATENGGFDWRGKDPAFMPQLATLTVTAEYGRTLGWEFVDGRDFSKDIASDSAGFVINEAAAKLFGFENPVGEVVQWQGGWRSKYTKFAVIGVIRDMIMKSPYSEPVPAVFFLSQYGTNWINIRINPNVSAGAAIPRIESVFRKYVPNAPFDYKFADQEYALKFVMEERVGKLATIFAALAILISCLGLFGLASFVAEQRTKEIGIRKVVGASVFSLWKMLSKDFVGLVLISCALAVLPSYYLLSSWLNNYEYRAELSWWMFVGTFFAALIITLLTVSYQAIKAALMNPVKSLRSE